MAASLPRYAVYDPNDQRKGTLLKDAVLGEIILAQAATITKALAACTPPRGAVVWDRQKGCVVYTVP